MLREIELAACAKVARRKRLGKSPTLPRSRGSVGDLPNRFRRATFAQAASSISRSMRREDDQELWDLLGQTKAPAASTFFARNVVRQVRQGGSDRVDFLRWLRPRILAPVAV